ncbi:MAG: ShlB/FhaC/HecB family hemolysin secretion/activation protein [Vampirovibrionales bacterium]|nr:ShlB/FhaC/HecB family hemolysin secretion/activation protein [Vampirovibrionales bacterium]
MRSPILFRSLLIILPLILRVNFCLAEFNADPGNILQDLQTKTAPDNGFRRDTILRDPKKIQKIDESGLNSEKRPSAEADAIVTRVDEVVVEGVTLLKKAEIDDITKRYAGKDLNYQKILTLIHELTDLYLDKGYITSRFYIPEQEIENNTLLIKAIEGVIGDINISTGKYFKEKSILEVVSLNKNDLLNIHHLERDLFELNRNPDRTVKAKLTPGTEQGKTNITLDTTDHFPFHVTPTFDNLGRSSIGSNRYGLRLAHNNLMGYGDQLLSSVSLTKRSVGVLNHYEFPLHLPGVSVGIDQGLSYVDVGGDVKALNIHGSATSYSPFVQKYWLDKEKYKLYTNTAFSFKQLDTNVQGDDYSRDNLRVLTNALTLEESDTHGRTFFRNEAAVGLDLFGSTLSSTPNISRTGAGGQFFKYSGSVIRLEKLPLSTLGLLRGFWQYSPDRLVSSELFQIGGAYTVRGYSEGLMSGDRGYLASAELRMPLYCIPSRVQVPFFKKPLRDVIQPIVFADYGFIGVNHPPSGVKASNQLLGVGTGIRIQLGSRLALRIDMGLPLIHQPKTATARVHFGIESTLF